MNGTIMTYCRYLAIQRVKQQLRDAGIKLSSVERRELTQAANAYIAGHPELLIEAAEKVQAIAACGRSRSKKSAGVPVVQN